MADAVYPLLRPRRRARLALPRLGPRARPIAIGLLAFAGVMSGVFAATRPAPVDAPTAIAASRTALASGGAQLNFGTVSMPEEMEISGEIKELLQRTESQFAWENSRKLNLQALQALQIPECLPRRGARTAQLMRAATGYHRVPALHLRHTHYAAA